VTWGDFPVLWLLAIVPILVVAYALDGQRRRRLLERIGHHQMIARMTATFSPARRRWRAVLLVAGVALLVLTLARPQMPGRAKLTESRGLDLVVALDFSKSMLARDIYPTRLDRAKAELARFIDTLRGDRVGLVAFAGETMSYPLTVDYEAAKLFWRDLSPDDMPVGGTDLGRALTASTELLTHVREREGKKRPAQVILLITDGEDTEGQGVAAAKKAAALGIKIFTLGIGSNEKPPVPLYDEDGKQHGYVSDDNGDPVRVGLDAAALQQIASLSGGEYVSLDPRRFGVDRVQAAIANLERTEEAARFEREPDDVGRWFLMPAFLVLTFAACVRERRRRKSSVVRVPSAEAAANVNEPSQRILAAMILILAWPLLSGFDILKRKDPNIEEGNRLLQAGKADDALKAYDRAVQALPEEPIAHFDRGVALYQLGKFPEAQKEFQRASEGHDPSVKADAYYNMGNSLLKQERFKDALDAYKHTLGLRPEDRRAKWNLELALRKLQEQKQQQQQQQKQSQNQQKPDDKQQQQQQSQQDQQKPDDKQQQEQQKQQEEQQKQQQQQAEQQKQEQQKQEQQQSPGDKEKQEREKLAQARAKKEQPREIDKQDAEAVLDALERVEPTVEKDLARQRALKSRRRPAKDW
jgi:Ca-activated chloride channel homolog